jgi:hypothetical protein
VGNRIGKTWAITSATKQAIAVENAAKFYGFQVPKGIGIEEERLSSHILEGVGA